MNTIANEEIYQAGESVRISTKPTAKAGKVSGLLSLILAGLAIISIFVPVASAFLFWNFLLLSAALSVFGFLETISAKSLMSNVTWLISLALLILLFIFAFDSFKNPQALYFYGAFSVIVQILLVISAFLTGNLAVGKSLSPLIIPAIFIFSLIFLNTKTAYFSLLLLPIGWGLLGILNYSESKK